MRETLREGFFLSFSNNVKDTTDKYREVSINIINNVKLL